MADLKGRVVLINGAGCGIGAGLAEGLAEAGATIYLTDRRVSADDPQQAQSLEAIAGSVENLGGRPVAHPLEQLDEAGLAAVLVRIAAEHGQLDVLVNNVYGAPDLQVSPTPFWQQSSAGWDHDGCGAGLRGSYAATLRAAGMMAAAGRGLIINVSADLDQYVRNDVGYALTRAGVDRMAAVMAPDLAAHQVSILTVHAGLVKSPAVLQAIDAGALSADRRDIRSSRFIGRCMAALAMDPDIAEKTGGGYHVSTLAGEYRFSDPDQPDETWT